LQSNSISVFRASSTFCIQFVIVLRDIYNLRKIHKLSGYFWLEMKVREIFCLLTHIVNDKNPDITVHGVW
ncbi:MAG: hypothetical protein QXH13_05105, partial [Thermoplasmata archaeon]